MHRTGLMTLKKLSLTALAFFAIACLNAQTVTPIDTVPAPPAVDPTTLPPEPQAATINTTAAVSDTALKSQPVITETATATTPATVPAYETSPVAPPGSTSVTPSETTSVAANIPSEPVPSSKAATSSDAANMRKANLLYSDKAYAEAIPFYEKALPANTDNKVLLANLGDCYRLTKNTAGQIKVYGDLVNMPEPDPLYTLFYAQALMENGEAEKAKPYFEKFNVDSRGKQLASSLEKMKMYAKNADAYNVNLLGFNSTENDFAAVMFRNDIVFMSARKKNDWIKREQGWTQGNFLHLYTTGKDFGEYSAPKLFMTDLKSKFNDGPVSFSRDFNSIYFNRNRTRGDEKAKDGTLKLEILEASLDMNGFSMVRPLSFNNKDFNFAHPSISNDGYTLYFASDMEGGRGGMDIYRCKKDSLGMWGAPENLGELVNSAGTEVFPFIAADGKLYFSSNGHDGLGGLDIYEAKFRNGQVQKIFNMGMPVNSKDDDFAFYLSEDNKNGFISSNRKSGGMDDDVYELQVMREVKRGKDVKLLIKDKDSGSPIPDAKIVLNGDTVKANDKGEYQLSAEDEMEYKVEALKDEYYKGEDKFTAESSPDDSFSREIGLEKDPKPFLRGLVTDLKSGELLDGVNIKIIDIETNNEIDNYVTTSSGDYFKFLWGKHMGDRLAFLIKLDKPGYLERTVVFTHVVDKPGEINLNEKLNLGLGKVAVGMDIGKLIDLKPIYFDFGKSDIRKDAAMELDKIVQVMNEYPNMFIELGSHTDCRSSAASNLKLSGNRAKNSVAYIVKKGINKMRIAAKGYGESKLLNNCACEGKVQSTCPEEEHGKNRRTEFVITKLK
jgi:outer membrane protein OmpA-like peptidoglycan-associated protein